MTYAHLVTYAGNVVSFSCGSIITWPSPVLEKLKSETYTPFSVPISSETATWISSFLPIGAIIGPFLYGFLSDKIGRKLTILSIGPPILLATLILAFATSVPLYYLARFLCGVAVGGLFGIFPNYIGEIADSKNRGALSSSLNVFLCAGMLMSYIVGPYVGVMAFNLILAIFPAMFCVLFFLFGTETAYYHLQKGNNDLARQCLRKVRSKNVEIDDELAVLKKKLDEANNASFFDIFRSKGLTKAFNICVGLILFQQFSGIIAVLFYAQQIFQDAGVSLEPALCSILVGAVQFAFSFATPLLVDRLGRKMLLYFSAAGMVLTEAPLAVYGFMQDQGKEVSSISFLPVVCLVGFIIVYNVGFGSLPWTIAGEMFPNNVKAIAASAVAGICWIFAFLISKYFESVKNALGTGPVFMIFTASCSLSLPFLYFVVLETKGKTLHEIQEELER